MVWPSAGVCSFCYQDSFSFARWHGQAHFCHWEVRALKAFPVHSPWSAVLQGALVLGS
jgi:hypothetical protein